VFEIEADRIREQYSDLLRDGAAHPDGACAFLDDDGACRIYDARPYVCRSEGLPFAWIGPAEDGSIVEQRSICPLNEDGTPVADLDHDDCWTLGPWEGRLAELQRARHGDQGRVALRALFDRPRS